ncbi:hypothetical protein PFISCL1PPCAC_12548, partial [Pristionchus fissidentatus]
NTDGTLVVPIKHQKQYGIHRSSSSFVHIHLVPDYARLADHSANNVTTASFPPFIIKWTAVDDSSCGASITWDEKNWPFEGSIQFPGFPNAYNPHTSCQWQLNSALENRGQLNFKLSFEYFDIPAKTCDENFIRISAKTGHRQKLNSRKMCNRRSDNVGEPIVLSMADSVSISFLSSDRIGGGFSLNYKLDCDNFVDDHAYISSLDINIHYECITTIVAKHNEWIVVKFVEISDDLVCNNRESTETLTINDNPIFSMTHPNRRLRPLIYKGIQNAALKYSSNGNSSFIVIVRKTTEPDCFRVYDQTSEYAGRIEIESAQSQSCTIQITTAGRIRYRITNIDFGANRTAFCTPRIYVYDYYVGADPPFFGNQLQRICEADDSDWVASDEEMITIIAESDRNTSVTPSFTVEWEVIHNVCNKTFSEPAGFIIFDDEYLHRDCQFLIKFESDHNIALKVNSMNIPCGHGNLMIRNGQSIESPLLNSIGHQ